MSKVVQYKSGHGMGAPYDLPGYEYDAVNDRFTDLETGKVFDKNSSSADLETNKAVTVDVSAYTSPVEVTPTSGKDAMEKVTVTLSNIPVAKSDKLYAWSDSTNLVYTATATPVAGTDKAVNQSFVAKDITNVTADTSIKVDGTTYSRSSTDDIAL